LWSYQEGQKTQGRQGCEEIEELEELEETLIQRLVSQSSSGGRSLLIVLACNNARHSVGRCIEIFVSREHRFTEIFFEFFKPDQKREPDPKWEARAFFCYYGMLLGCGE
jgi:hypothetical protein